MAFDFNDVLGLLAILRQEKYHGDVELKFRDGDIVFYRKMETFSSPPKETVRIFLNVST